MSVTAEDALSLALFCVAERALGYLRRKAQPSCVETVKVAGKPVLSVEFLQPEENELPQPRNLEVPDGKTIELMAVDGQVPHSAVVPLILLIDRHSHQVRHDFRQAVIVVPFHPDDFDIVPGIGKLADIAEKLPVLFRQAAEVEVGEDIAQQDEAAKSNSLEELQSVTGAAHVRSQVQVGEDYRIEKALRHHALSL